MRWDIGKKNEHFHNNLFLIKLHSPLPLWRYHSHFSPLFAGNIYLFACEIEAIHHSQACRPCDRPCGEADLVTETLSAFYFITPALSVYGKQHETSRAPSSPGPQRSQSAAASSFAFIHHPLECGWIGIYLHYSQKLTLDCLCSLPMYADSASFRLLPASSSAHMRCSRERCSAQHLFMPKKNCLSLWEMSPLYRSTLTWWQKASLSPYCHVRRT